MSVDELSIEFDYSSPDLDGFLGDNDSLSSGSETQALTSPSLKTETFDKTCPVCNGVLESGYQEHIQVCAISSSSIPYSPPSPVSTTRLYDNISKYRTQFQGLGIHKRLQMMESLQRLARRCASDSSSTDSPVSPFSPDEKKAGPTQELDDKVLSLLFTDPSKKKSKRKREDTKINPPSTRLRLDTPSERSDPIGRAKKSTFPKLTLDPLDKDPVPLIDFGFGNSFLSPLASPSSFEFSLSPPKEGTGTTFFLTPSQSTPTPTPVMSNVSKPVTSRPPMSTSFGHSTFGPSTFGHSTTGSSEHSATGHSTSTGVSTPSLAGNGSNSGLDSRTHEEILKFLISQYQVLLSRTEAFLRTIPVEPTTAELTAPPIAPTMEADPTSTIQQLAAASAKRLQQSFAQVAALQEKISHCAQSSMFQSPNSFGDRGNPPLPAGFSSLLASFAKKPPVPSWGYEKAQMGGLPPYGGR